MLPSGVFLYVDFGGGGEMGVYMNVWIYIACNAMQYENYRMSKLNVCLLDVTVICVYM